MNSTPATESLEVLKNSLAHQEAIELTLAWVREMQKRLPALSAALQAKKVRGCSPREDLKQIEAALKCLGYFTPSEVPFYKPTAAELKAKIADLEAPAPAPSFPLGFLD